MAQYSTLTHGYIPQATTNFEVNMVADRYGNIEGRNGDAFDRLRTSIPFTLGDYKHIYGNDGSFIDFAIGGGTVSYRLNEASARLQVVAGASSGAPSSALHQTRKYHHYLPGKSQLALCSFVFGNSEANVLRRIGLFDDDNGIFLEQSPTALSFVIRTSTSGTSQDIPVARANWSVDKFDGTGPSGATLDITKTQLMWIDFQWLGVGRVRCGFVDNGIFYTAHEFYHSNVLSTVYISDPTLPIRSEILAIGANTGAYMDHICSSVISEGGYVESGYDHSYTQTTLRSLAAGATLPVLAIRLQNTFNTKLNRTLAKLLKYSVISTGANIRYRLLKLSGVSKITTPSWSPVSALSAVEYTVGATAFTEDLELDGGWVSGDTLGSKLTANPQSKDFGVAKTNFISQNLDSTDSEIYVIIVTNLSSTDATTCGASFQWREIY